MTDNDLSNARHQLNRAIFDDSYGLYSDHPWFWEGARWTELLFALAARLTAADEEIVRDMIAELSDLDLLDPSKLAILPRLGDAGLVDPAAQGYQHLAETMMRYGLEGSEMQRVATAFADAARAIVARFDGKIQKYLRKYGEQMLAELGTEFAFTDLSEAEAADAFTEWLQNCLNMPVSLRDADMREFCQGKGISEDDLVAAADAEDVNLAYLDDLIQARIRAEIPGASETPGAAARESAQ